jgi:hypothetical protein
VALLDAIEKEDNVIIFPSLQRPSSSPSPSPGASASPPTTVYSAHRRRPHRNPSRGEPLPSPLFCTVGSRSSDPNRSLKWRGMGGSDPSDLLLIRRSRTAIHPKGYQLIRSSHVSVSETNRDQNRL